MENHMALPTVHDVDPAEVGFDLYEVKTSELAEIVGVSASTIHKWVKDNITAPTREDYLGYGRPALVFDLHTVFNDLEAEESKHKYLSALRAEIADRELADEAENEPVTEEVVRIEDTMSPEPLPEVLVEILRDGLAEVRDDLRYTQTALAKILRDADADPDAPVFTYGEAVAMHNALATLAQIRESQ